MKFWCGAGGGRGRAEGAEGGGAAGFPSDTAKVGRAAGRRSIRFTEKQPLITFCGRPPPGSWPLLPVRGGCRLRRGVAGAGRSGKKGRLRPELVKKCRQTRFVSENISTFAAAIAGCSSARLEYTSGGRVVAGSNPVTPTASSGKSVTNGRLPAFFVSFRAAWRGRTRVPWRPAGRGCLVIGLFGGFSPETVRCGSREIVRCLLLPEISYSQPPASRPVVVTARPVAAAARPVVAASRPVAAAPRPVVAASRPVVAASRPVVVAARPVVVAARPVVATARPVVTTARPVVTASRPVVATAWPVAAAARPVVAVSRLVAGGSGGENGKCGGRLGAGRAENGIRGAKSVKNGRGKVLPLPFFCHPSRLFPVTAGLTGAAGRRQRVARHFFAPDLPLVSSGPYFLFPVGLIPRSAPCARSSGGTVRRCRSPAARPG